MMQNISRQWLAGWVISALAVAFLVLDGAMKAVSSSASVETTVELGYPAWLVPWIGVLLLVCLVVYLVPQTSVIGAILLTGFLGGATTTQVRVEDPWFVLPVILAVMLWAGLLLREDRLREFILLRRRAYVAGDEAVGEVGR